MKAYFRYRRTAACLRDWRSFDDFRVIIVVKNVERLSKVVEQTVSSPLIKVAAAGYGLTRAAKKVGKK